MRIGFFGGSFDPIHAGHIGPAREARRQLELERVLFLPTARPPHKPERKQAPPLARFAMVELALLEEEGLEGSARELTLARPTFTVDTLEQLREEFREAELFLLVGADSFADLPQWVRWRDILAGAQIAVLRRPGWEFSSTLAAGPPEIAAAAQAGRIHAVSNASVAISSTELRGLLARGEAPPSDALPELVLKYIRKYNLYR